MKGFSKIIGQRFVFLLFAVALTGALIQTTQAQENKVVEPTAIGIIYWLDPSNGALVQLDRENTNIKSSPGFFKSSAKLRVNGVKAAMRLKPSKPEFVMQLANGVDPTKIKLYLLTVTGGKRETVILTVVAFGGAKSELKTLTVDVTKYGQSSYKLTPAQPLAPGEYVLVATDSTDAYCFGVDPVM